MFTGIVEEVGPIRSFDRTSDSVRIWVDAVLVREGLALGDSVSVDGACLTIAALDARGFAVGLSPETLRRTALGTAMPGTTEIGRASCRERVYVRV